MVLLQIKIVWKVTDPNIAKFLNENKSICLQHKQNKAILPWKGQYLPSIEQPCNRDYAYNMKNKIFLLYAKIQRSE